MTVPPAEPMPNESYDWGAAAARLRDAADSAGDAPEAWIPTEPGAEIMGRLVEVNPAAHTAFGDVPVVTLESPRGRRSVWLHHAVLRRGFERANVQLGEVVLVRFVGKVQPEGGGNAWHDYRVVVDREHGVAGADWVAIAKAHGDEVELAREAEQAAAELEQQARELEAPPPAARAPVPSSTETGDCAGGHDYVDDGAGGRACSRCGDVDIPF